MRKIVTVGVIAALNVWLAIELGGCSDDSSGQPGATSGTGATTTSAVGGSTSIGSNTGGSTASNAASTGAGGPPPPPTEISECQGHVYACGDLEDNDGDMLIDYQDPDCLGPCDNTEDSYFGGISGQPGPPCTVDCYFDQDSGAGNDDCYWNHKCDPHETAPDYYPESCNGTACAHDPNASTPGTTDSCAELLATQSQQCLDYCGPLTPNGCDCFGCCELPAGSGMYVWLGSDDNCIGSDGGSCSQSGISDPGSCEPCQPVTACLNDCDTCELCIGKTTLPPECYDPDGGGGQECPEGVQQCGLPGQDPCPSAFYCISGCCQPIPQ
jgi:hypothetical protein